MPDLSPFAPYLHRWSLTPDGAPIHTHSSDLLPVRWPGGDLQGGHWPEQPAMLKVARSAEEITGNRLMVWLAGDGAAQVYAHDGAALVLERLQETPSLAQLAQARQDDEATRILCRVVAHLHRPRAEPPPKLPTLRQWFRSLEQAATQHELFEAAWAIARELLETPQDVRALHGDIHHGNVLQKKRGHSERGWLAIDPKGIYGERGYDYANLFYNPSLKWALTPGWLARQSALVAEWAALERPRLLRWIIAYGGLSAAWWLEDGKQDEVRVNFEVVRLALSELAHFTS